jgi:molecular chaperone GrpE
MSSDFSEETINNNDVADGNESNNENSINPEDLENYDPFNLSEKITLELRDELKTLKQDLEEQKDKYVRLLAEFDNYKRNSLRQREEILKYQGQHLVTDLLDVVDNFELALNHSTGDSESVKAGITLIHKLFIETFEKWGIKGESSIGTKFDPNIHNAIAKAPSSEYESGTVVNELKRAFYYKDKLLRPAEVVVSDDS